MVNTTRRNFLRRTSAMAVSGALTACGGSVAELDGSDGLSAGSPVTTLAATTVGPTALSNANFSLTSVSAQSRAPYTLGYAFQQGDVPKGSTVTADSGTLQVISKNTWPDGSLKFAVLSGFVDLAANTAKTINLSRTTTPLAGTPLDTVRLRFTNIVAEVGAGAFGSARWSGADWSTPFATWVSGPLMSSWIYRKPIGTDKHLVAWLEVRLFNNGMVEVLPWIENGYLQVLDPTNKVAKFTFTLGKTQHFSALIDLKHHQRTPLISGSALSYWLGSDASVVPVHNKAYLQATELVPSYMANSNSAGALTTLVTTFQPLQAGNFRYDQDSMASSGYQDPIGLLPQHDVLYLTSDALQAYGAVVRNGFSAGRWGIHYRDETTNRPPRFSAYPNLNIRAGQGFKDTGGSTKKHYTPVATGGNAPNWDIAHSPAVGYLAYLLTGRWYFMEEVQFAATANYLGNGDNAKLRDGAKGLVQPRAGAWQVRSCAWDWRAKVQALTVTADSDTALRSEFIASVEANIAFFHGQYIARPNNPYGWVNPGESYLSGTAHFGAPWQQDFVTAAFGYAVSLALPVSTSAAANLLAFFKWKAKSAVMRLGTRSGFWYINAAPYTMSISPVPLPDFDTGAGPWHASEAEVYAVTYAQAPSWLGNTEGMLTAEHFPGERAMWGNLMPAIAYAVRHGVTGASAAYQRMTNASNWTSVRNAFNERPVWSVKPAKMTLDVEMIPAPVDTVAPAGSPSWLAGAAVGQWVEIPGTGGAGGSAVGAYSGFAYNERTNEIFIAAAGGHRDSSDNRVVSLRLTDNQPTWIQRHAPSSNVVMDVAYYPDNKPSSRHLYAAIAYIPQYNRVMLFGARSTYGNAHFFRSVDGFNLETNTWDAPGTWADVPANTGFGALVIPSTGEVWTTGLARWSPATKSFDIPITSRTDDPVRMPVAHDSKRNQLFTLNWGDGFGSGADQLFSTIVPLPGAKQYKIGFNPSSALDQMIIDKPSYSAMDYDPINDCFLFYCGQGAGAGRVYVIKPNASLTWDISIWNATGPTPPASSSAGVQNRLRYVPALRGFVLLPNKTANLFFIRSA